MLNPVLERLSALNKQVKKAIGPSYAVRYLPKVVGSASVDYDSDLKGSLNVTEFYSGKTVFITGCTGFLAKVILEKLFRTCHDVGKIYIMVRPKRKMSPM